MLTPEELAELTKFHKDSEGQRHVWELGGPYSGPTFPLSQNAHSAIAKLLQRELVEQGPEAPWHETQLIHQVRSAVTEYTSDASEYMFGRSRIRTADRKPHSEVIAEAVQATLIALGYTVRLDGSVEKP